MNIITRADGLLPPIVSTASERARFRFLEFFTANIRNPNTRKAYAKAAGDFSIAVEDGFDGYAMTVAKDRLQRFTDLPSRAPDGFHIEIVGDETTAFDNYFVAFEKSAVADSAGVWRETIAQGAKHRLDAASLPHLLVREADGTFTFRRATWGERAVGDAASAPEPRAATSVVRLCWRVGSQGKGTLNGVA